MCASLLSLRVSASQSEEEAEKVLAGMGLGGADESGGQESLPHMPSAEEDMEAELRKAEKELELPLTFLSQAVEERIMQERYDVRVPYKVGTREG